MTGWSEASTQVMLAIAPSHPKGTKRNLARSGAKIERVGLTVVLIALVIESSFASGRFTDLDEIAPPLYSAGRQLWINFGGYYIPWIAILILAAFRAFRGHVPRRAFFCGILVGLVAVAFVAFQGVRDAAQAGLPYVVLIATASLIAGSASTERGRQAITSTLVIVNVATVLRALVAAFASSSERFVPFYDGVAIVLAGACVVGSLSYPRFERKPLFWTALAAFLLAGSIGSRRASLVAVIASVVLTFAIARASASLRSRLAAALVAAGAVLWLSVGSEIGESFNTIVNNAGEKSTSQHVEDVEYGWFLCQTRASLMSGLGPRSPQLNGLASTEGKSLYIHNEYWQVCVGSGYGALGLLVGGLFAALLLTAVELRHSVNCKQPLFLAGAIVVFALPVVLVWFPYLSTTPRWPILAGLAIGLVFASRASRRTSEGSE